MTTKLNLSILTVSLFITGIVTSCKNDDTTPKITAEFKNRSVTPAFIKMAPEFSSVGVHTLVSSEDAIPNSGDMIYGGAPDGQGFIKNPDGSGYIM
ncbi:MAG: hypothetical protein ACKOE6_05235, partial [Flammeovirgaceae bacterium]